MTGPNTAPAQGIPQTEETAGFQIASVIRPVTAFIATLSLMGAAEASAKVDRDPTTSLVCRQIESKTPLVPKVERNDDDPVIRLGGSLAGGTTVLLAAENMPQRRGCDPAPKPNRPKSSPKKPDGKPSIRIPLGKR